MSLRKAQQKLAKATRYALIPRPVLGIVSSVANRATRREISVTHGGSAVTVDVTGDPTDYIGSAQVLIYPISDGRYRSFAVGDYPSGASTQVPRLRADIINTVGGAFIVNVGGADGGAATSTFEYDSGTSAWEIDDAAILTDVEVQEDDVKVTDATVFNFEGGGGKVTDEGSGKVTVDITGSLATVDVEGTAGENLSERDFVYLASADNEWYQVDTDATATVEISAIRGLVKESGGINEDATGTIRLIGELSGFSSLTAGSLVYGSTTAGGYTQTKPTLTDGGAQIAIVPFGVATSTTAVAIVPHRVQFQKRDTVANNGTLTLEHYSDALARLRRVGAYLSTSTEATAASFTTNTDEVLLRELGSSSATSYTDGNQDCDIPLRADLLNSYVAWWGLNETSGTRDNKEGDAGNDLSDNNTVLYGTGKQGYAADFERDNSEYLSCADNADLSCGDTNLYFCGWIKYESVAASMGVFSKYDSGGNEYQLWYYTNFSAMSFDVYGADTNWYYGTETTVGVPSVDTWYFFEGYFDTDNNVVGISLNCNSRDTTAMAVAGVDTDRPFVMGYNYDTSYCFDGLIDEVMCTRRILSTAERDLMYNNGEGLKHDLAKTKDKLAQSFQSASAVSCGGVGLYLKKSGSPTGTMTIRIETDNSGEPSGSLVDAGATTTLAESGLGSSYGWEYIEFGDSFTLAASTTYWLVISTDRAASTDNWICWGADQSSPSYASGELMSEIGGTWTSEGKDACFIICDTFDQLAQSFQISGAGTAEITRVELNMRKYGTPTGTMTLRIETDSGGSPSGTLADANATVTLAESGLTTSLAYVEFDFASNFDLTESTTYWLVLSTDREPDFDDQVSWGYDDGEGYASGAPKTKSGGAWSALAGDCNFKIYEVGTPYEEVLTIGQWDAGTRDLASRMDDGAGSDGDTKTTIKNVIGSSTDITLVVELP